MLSVDKQYELLREQDSISDSDDLENERLITRHKSTIGSASCLRTTFLIFILLVSNACTVLIACLVLKGHGTPTGLATTSSTGMTAPTTAHITDVQDYPIVDELPTTYAKFKWWTPWGLEAGATNNVSLPSAHVADELWDGIRPDHGLVAVDRQWAKERNWPDSMYLPKDPHGNEKGVYLLEAYHLLHCLKIIRLSFVETLRGAPLTWPVGHTTHCFDIMRQSIQCNADNTPLYTFGDMTAGDGQLRKCKSWDALRDWATEHTACYRDSVEKIPLRDHFGFCQEGKPYQDGDDGLP